ncbi:MAG: permease [Lachnospiraceae bacterium]|nr:permease [Lachnospiraceae bacterium]
MDTYIFYGLAIIFLIISFVKDKKKTKTALKKAWKSFENILPQFLAVILIVSVLLAVVDADFISKVIGKDSGWAGVLLSAVLGAITLIPAFVAFPTAAMVLEAGAGYMQIGAFVSTLTMVGIVTMPVEIKIFGKKLTVLRNLFAFVFSFFVAYVISVVVG